MISVAALVAVMVGMSGCSSAGSDDDSESWGVFVLDGASAQPSVMPSDDPAGDDPDLTMPTPNSRPSRVPAAPFAPHTASCPRALPVHPSLPRRAGYITWRDGRVTSSTTSRGGQPVWRAAPQWPSSRRLGTPMTFVAQIALNDDVVPGGAGHTAYLFVSAAPGLPTWDPEQGESAVVIQPGGSPVVPTRPLRTGPTRHDEVEVAKLATQLDPAFVPEADGGVGDDVWSSIAPEKVGGTPAFLQYDEFPECGRVDRLALQLELGTGVGYVFVTDDLAYGKYVEQY
ncbi:hypothetical protein GCM10027515_00020 [Schumannella luteola]